MNLLKLKTMKITAYILFFGMLILSCKNVKKQENCECEVIKETENCNFQYKLYETKILYPDGKKDTIIVKAANKQRAKLRCEEQCPNESSECK
jgi:hypothetical protein